MAALAACSKKTDTKKDGAKADVDLKKLITAMEDGSKDFPDGESLYTGDKDDKKWFEYLCDFDYDKIEEYGISYAVNSTADEIFVIRLNSSADVDEMRASLEKRKESRKTTFNTYAPEEVAKIDSALITSYRNIVAFVIAKDTEGAQEAFSQAFK